MQSDDLFLRKMRGGPSHSRPPTTLQRSSSEATLGTPPSPRARTHSHEETPPGGGSGPRRFRDPLVLLGLGGGAAGGDPEVFPRPPWPHFVAHYDVQSIVFDPFETPPDPPGTSGASAAHLDPPPETGDPPEFGAPPQPQPDAGDALVLSCPRFVCEVGGEKEEGLGTPPRDEPPGLGHVPNAAVAVLEEPPPGERPPHAIEHCDGGAGFYRKYFYGKGEGGAEGRGTGWGGEMGGL